MRHFNAHKEQRHVPYTLHKVQEAINFKKLADDHDLWPSTLHAINTGTLVRGDGLTEHGLQACTADAGFAEEEEAPEEEVEEASTGITGVNGMQLHYLQKTWISRQGTKTYWNSFGRTSSVAYMWM